MSTGWNWPYSLPDGSDLLQRLLQSEQSMCQLSDRIRKLEMQVEELRTKTPLHIEYHFDQLKVNELKGTLNVGLSPQGVQGIDSFETPPVNWQPSPEAGAAVTQEPIGTLQQQMNDYMDRDAPAMLMNLEKKHGIPLGEEHRGRVLKDVRDQLKERVHHYSKTTPYPASGSDDERRQWSRSVIERTTRDIGAAFSAYLAELKGSALSEGGESA